MHVQIITITGQRINLPMSWHSVLNGPGRLGDIYLEVEKGVGRHVPKSAIVDVLEFTDDKWDEIVKMDAERAEAQKKAQEAQAQAKVHRWQQAQAEIDKWNAQPWHKKIGRNCTIALPAEKA